MVGLLRLRFAAGVCVLAAGLLMGAGGAVAVADPGDDGTTLQASSIPPARKSRRTSLAARTPRMGRKTTRTSVPRFLIRSPRFRTRSRRFLMRWRRFLWRWRRFRMWSGQFLMSARWFRTC